jgi:putative PLP-dependent aminotransferase (TIGR04422 family)
LINNYFLWPESKIANGLSSFWKLISSEEVENKLFEMFPSGYPVLCSSGRSALYLALSASGTSRQNFVGVFPYASHCVLDSISRIATPSTGITANSEPLRVVYHQWGFVQEHSLASNTIEDCVDTLCIPGSDLFPGGGDFEIWSLPKILGTTSGGILWCKNPKKASQVKKLRDSRGSSFFQWILRLLSKNSSWIYNYWQGAESVTGRPSLFQTGEIMSAISKWDNIVQDRKKKLDLVWPLALIGLEKPIQRLPTVVPVESEMEETTLHQLGFSSGYRMFEMVNKDGSRRLIKVLPLPIFKEVATNWLMDMRNILLSKNDPGNA